MYAETNTKPTEYEYQFMILDNLAALMHVDLPRSASDSAVLSWNYVLADEYKTKLELVLILLNSEVRIFTG